MYTNSIPDSQVVGSTKFKDKAVALLREKVYRGELLPGSRLSEVALAKELAISRTPIREALMQLNAAGVVEQLPRYGWYVRTPSRSEIVELYEMRELLECHAAYMTAKIANAAQISELHEAMARFRAIVKKLKTPTPVEGKNLAAHQQELTDLDLLFHERILLFCGNGWLLNMASQCRLLTRLHAVKQSVPFGTDPMDIQSGKKPSAVPANWLRVIRRTLHQHYQIFKAIRQRDAQRARDLMSVHIRAGLANTIKLIDGDSGSAYLSQAIASNDFS